MMSDEKQEITQPQQKVKKNGTGDRNVMDESNPEGRGRQGIGYNVGYGGPHQSGVANAPPDDDFSPQTINPEEPDNPTATKKTGKK